MRSVAPLHTVHSFDHLNSNEFEWAEISAAKYASLFKYVQTKFIEFGRICAAADSQIYLFDQLWRDW